MNRKKWLLICMFLMASSSTLIKATPIPNDTNKRSSTLPECVKTNWWSIVQENIANSEYEINWQNKAGAYQSPNRVQNLRFTYYANGFAVEPRQSEGKYVPWKVSLKLTAFGRSSKLHSYKGGPLNVLGNKAEVVSCSILINYVNKPEGMRQNFVVKKKLLGKGKLILKFNMLGQNIEYSVIVGKYISFRANVAGGAEVMRYGDMKIYDSEGRDLKGCLEMVSDDQIAIVVDDRNAVYPITIDPLSSIPDWTAESNQQNADFGISVSQAGDVNGDGYSDVIIGAYGYDNGQMDEGRAFVYYGSAAGLSVTPNWTAESDQDGAWFSNSVSQAGDVNGDGYSDVIIGAYGYDNGQIDEGRAFVYYGSAAGLSVTPDWSVESNQSRAHFGSSVSQASDVNGDGYSDVIISAPFYDHGQSDEGRTYVYHGSAAGLSLNPDWGVESNQSRAYFGHSVSQAGDVNGDGYSDVIIGAYGYDNGQIDEGRAFVYYGSAAGLSVTPDWTAESDQENANFGWSVSQTGDVNGDGYSDIIVSALYFDNGQADEGRAYVYEGSGTGLTTSPSWTAESEQANGLFGQAIAGAGDVNGDGYADVIIGARSFNNGEINEGRAFVYHGSSSGLSLTPDWIAESDQENANFGWSVSQAGDVNGDGYSDVIIGAIGYDNGQCNEGRVFLYYGSASGISLTPNWTAESNQIRAYFGHSVSQAGDVNGDGYSDVIIGAYGYDNGEEGEGRAFVYYGSAAGLSVTPDWTAESDHENADFGWSVSQAGDVNGDGYSDIIVGAYNYSNPQGYEGKAYVYHGSAVGLSLAPDWSVESNQDGAEFGFSVSTAGDVNGDGFSDVIIGLPGFSEAYVYHGSADGLSLTANWTAVFYQSWAYFGWSVSQAGDVNGDGYSDVIIGAPDASFPQMGEGGAYVYHGSANGLSINPKWRVESNQTGAWFGVSTSTAGDVNGDGYSDIIVGAHYFDNGQADEGRAYAYHGSAGGLSITPNWTAESDQTEAYFGHSVSQAGDVNGDGYSDVIIGAYGYDNGQSNEGQAFVYYGSAAGLSLTPDWTAESDQTEAYFGHSVSQAGDVNGDGYSDIIVGAQKYDIIQIDEGRTFLYHGNKFGLSLIPTQNRYNSNTPVQLTNATGSNGVRLNILGRTPAGRGDVKLQWEIKPLGQSMNGTDLGISTSWSNTGVAGVTINEDISGLQNSTAYHWRVRLKYSPLNYNGSVYSRWFSIGPNSWNEKDFITTGLIGIEEQPIVKPQETYKNLIATIFRGPLILPVNRSCCVFDITGRMVMPDKIKPGIYFIEIDGKVIQKVIKIR